MYLFAKPYRDDCDVADIQLGWCINIHNSKIISACFLNLYWLLNIFFLKLYLLHIDNPDN